MKQTNQISNNIFRVTGPYLFKIVSGSLMCTAILAQQACTTLPTVKAPVTHTVNPASAKLIEREITAFVVKQEGVERLVPITAATHLVTGDLVEYQGHFTNKSTEHVAAMEVTMTIPKEVVFMGHTMPKYPLASVDGRQYNAVPLSMTVNGQLQNIPLSQYKSLRFDIGSIGVNETATVSYRAVVK